MRLTMSEKKSLTKVFTEKYKYASKLEKVLILNEFIDYTGYNRGYAARVLRDNKRSFKKTPRKKPAIYYNDEVKDTLEKLWRITDYICGKRLVAIIPELIKKCKQFDEMEISDAIKQKLEKISPATIDRLLKPYKKSLNPKGSSMTKGTRYLIDRIPIKTFTEWKDSPAGFTQMDLVAHNGGNVYGGFLYTLDTTDISTSWTVCTLVKDKSMPVMTKALQAVQESFPFPLKGIHSDNGSEFINDSVLTFAENHNLIFTRGRPYKKNDNPHVEQKNNSIIRRNTGYLRYDQPEHAEILQELYAHLNLYVNYFQPVMILREKHRIGAKAIRKYDAAQTPFQRILKSDSVSDEVKDSIRAIYKTLNPAELKRKINEYQAKLIRIAAPIRLPIKPVRIRRKKQMQHTVPVGRREQSATNANPFLQRQRIEELRRATDTVLSKRV
ncbi:MAG: transposase family protein [Spirochaetes bacterium]|nr:transposase family protein [Spirochaetota bacterium]MBN2772304.1 transposase family protein [Spirochaetota bacterium]